MRTQGRFARFDARIAEQTLFRTVRLPVEVHLLVRAPRYAVAPPAATGLVHQHDPVFVALVHGPGRTGRHARGIQAVLAQARQVHHEHVLEIKIGLGFEPREVAVGKPGDGRAAEVVLPVAAPLRVERLSRDRRIGTGHGLMPRSRAVRQPFIIVFPRLIVVVEGRQIRVRKNICQLVGLAARPQMELAVPDFPAALVTVLIFPFFGIAHAGLGFHVVEPHVFRAGGRGPRVLARDAARVAREALVQVQHHAHLHLDIHTHILLRGESAGGETFLQKAPPPAPSPKTFD